MNKLTNSQMQKVNELFLGASPDQMNEIAQIFNTVRSLKAASAAKSFTTGQKVKWSGRKGAMEGVVVKSLKKNIQVSHLITLFYFILLKKIRYN